MKEMSGEVVENDYADASHPYNSFIESYYYRLHAMILFQQVKQVTSV